MKKLLQIGIAVLVLIGFYFATPPLLDMMRDRESAPKTLKIGFLGVMSGPSASWGLVNRYCIEVAAKEINRQGGWRIGQNKYTIELIAIDDERNPQKAVEGAKRLLDAGVKYIIGPNAASSLEAILPLLEEKNAISVAYALDRALYEQPNENAVLGMLTAAQAGRVIYQYLRDERDVQTVSFISSDDQDSITQRNDAIREAEALGLEVFDAHTTYDINMRDFAPLLGDVVAENPDLIVLAGARPGNAPHLVKAIRILGYQGIISTEASQDTKLLKETAGDFANGFIFLGGATGEEVRSQKMSDFIKRYQEHVGVWNDEAGTKVYALEMILQTLAFAGEQAIEDVDLFKQSIPQLRIRNPFLKENQTLSFIGETYFGQKRQIGVPAAFHYYENGESKMLFVSSLAE